MLPCHHAMPCHAWRTTVLRRWAPSAILRPGGVSAQSDIAPLPVCRGLPPSGLVALHSWAFDTCVTVCVCVCECVVYCGCCQGCVNPKKTQQADCQHAECRMQNAEGLACNTSCEPRTTNLKSKCVSQAPSMSCVRTAYLSRIVFPPVRPTIEEIHNSQPYQGHLGPAIASPMDSIPELRGTCAAWFTTPG